MPHLLLPFGSELGGEPCGSQVHAALRAPAEGLLYTVYLVVVMVETGSREQAHQAGTSLLFNSVG